MKRLTLVLAVALAFFVAVGVAGAAWIATGTGNGYSKGLTMPTGNTPSASVSGVDVTVSWTANTIGGAAVSGYNVDRYNTSDVLQSIGSACTGLVASASCVESSVPGGRWKYKVKPLKDNWVGAQSAFSSVVHVVDKPTSVACGNCAGMGSVYINSTIVTAATATVVVPSTSEAGDTVHLTLSDGTNTVTASTKSGIAGGGTLTWSGGSAINASTLNQGTITFTAWVTEGSSTSANTTNTTTYTKDTVAPTASNISAPNSGATVGKMDANEVFTYTFSEQMDPNSILTGWNGSSTNVTMAWTNSPDNFTITSTNLGTLVSNSNLVSNTVSWTSSPMVMSGSTITITLGTCSNTSRLNTDNVAQNMSWTPSATAKDRAGNAMSTTAKAETDNDVDF